MMKSTWHFPKVQVKTPAPKNMHTIAEHAHRNEALDREEGYVVQHKACTQHMCVKQITL